MLPDLIEIVPLHKPVRAEITVPGSKSITNRALILAALADGETTLRGALWSEDTQVMADCLEKLGFTVTVKPDPDEFCNRTITVKGLGGQIPNAGTADEPLELFVGNAGTAARFLSAFVCLGNGVYRLHGVPRMHERPQAALFKALRELGYRVDSPNDKLPATILGTGPRAGKCTVSIEESSQFASALLLCAKVGDWKVNIIGENAEESPYVAMTSMMIEAFPKNRGIFSIEPDASSGSYFWAVGWLFHTPQNSPDQKTLAISRFDLELLFKGKIVRPKFFSVRVLHWPDSEWQVDQRFPASLPEPPDFKGVVSRATDLGDSIMTAMILAPFAREACRFTDLARLRVQETERVAAMENELKRCGARAEVWELHIKLKPYSVLLPREGESIENEQIDSLTVYPSALHGAEIETYNDHRMAMCFAILGLKVPGIKIKNPACVKKTFPNFFQKLAAAPPRGLGATILDAKTGRKLEEAELFAD